VIDMDDGVILNIRAWPITMRLMSPRKTAPYQTLDSSLRVMSPMTVAPETTNAVG
jgi:hypothetical protein